MDRPNLLFIYTDEQRFDTLAAYGNPWLDMPNLNRLAEKSTVFEEAYVTQPVCTPSRSSLLTGQWPHTNGLTENNIPLRPGTRCLPEMLEPGAYRTAHHGKWHLGDEIYAQHGFDDWAAIEDSYRRFYGPSCDRDDRSTYHHWLIDRGLQPKNGSAFGRYEASLLPEEFGKPAFLADAAERFLHSGDGRPFCLFINFLEPHMPFNGPRDAQYDPARLPLPDNFDALPASGMPLRTWAYQAHQVRAHLEHCGLHGEEGWRTLRARYFGLCSLVDTHVGRIMQALEESGQADNTIIVFTSDHGDMMGSHRTVAKELLYQEAVRVPLLVHLPGQSRQCRVTGPFSHIDLLPTLLDLLGEDVPSAVQGTSRRALVENGGQTADDVFIEWTACRTEVSARFPGLIDDGEVPSWLSELGSREDVAASLLSTLRTIVTPEGWRFTCSSVGEHELYNLKDDPGETNNLAGRHCLMPLMRDLRRRIADWQERTGDTASMTTL